MKRRTVLKIAAAILALLGVLACEGKPQGPGEARCIDDAGHRTACPKQW